MVRVMREQRIFRIGGGRQARTVPARWMSRHRRGAGAVVCLITSLMWTATASAQLDPLLFAKRVPPTVIVVVDTSMSMLQDGAGYYYDPTTYTTAHDTAAATALGVDVLSATTYRRKYQNFDWDGVADDNKRYVASRIV